MGTVASDTTPQFQGQVPIMVVVPRETLILSHLVMALQDRVEEQLDMYVLSMNQRVVLMALVAQPIRVVVELVHQEVNGVGVG